MSKFENRILRVGALAALCLVAALLASCKEKDVPFVVDEDELIRYVNETTEGKQLFDTVGIIVPQPYSFASHSHGIYLDSVISHERSYYIRTTGKDAAVDYGALGQLREAHVHVTDKYTIQTIRDYPDQVPPITLVDTTTRSIRRLGFFLKLGDDGQEYVGWVLWGFNGIDTAKTSGVTRLRRYDNSVFLGGNSIYNQTSRDPTITPAVHYVKLTDLDTVVEGSRLIVTMDQDSSISSPSVYSLAGTNRDSVFIDAMAVSDTLSFDTVYTRTNPPVYNLLFVQEFANDRFKYRSSWCIPYVVKR